ncbi:hypothetical protein DFS34DRAFT_592044 [Phlyctochytrium arcticum]|nr:hypothetical protein DFS34DRAFT_592044 [Phlyctochytrium arcticum]
MSGSPLDEYLATVAQAIREQQGETLADLTDPLMPQDWVDRLTPELYQIPWATIDAKVSAVLASPTDSFILAFLSYLKTEDERDFYDVAAGVFASFCNPVFQRTWQLPVLKRLCNSLISLATSRDAYLKSLHKRSTARLNLQNRFSFALGLVLADRPATFAQTRSAVLLLANTALRFCMQMDEFAVCSKIVRQVEAKLGKEFGGNEYPVGQRVMFAYLVGRLKVFNHQFKAAERHLSFALKHCHPAHTPNRLRILPLLIATRLVRALLPHPHLLKKYNLETYFLPLLQAYKTGHFRYWNSHLATHAHIFTQWGILSLLQTRCQLVMFRNLFRHVCQITSTSPGTNGAMTTTVPTQIQYKDLLTATCLAGFDPGTAVDMGVIESIVVSLCAGGWIKGYTLPERGLVVVSKVDPFPTVHSLVQGKPKRVIRRTSQHQQHPPSHTHAHQQPARQPQHHQQAFQPRPPRHIPAQPQQQHQQQQQQTFQGFGLSQQQLHTPALQQQQHHQPQQQQHQQPFLGFGISHQQQQQPSHPFHQHSSTSFQQPQQPPFPQQQQQAFQNFPSQNQGFPSSQSVFGGAGVPNGMGAR